MANISTNEVKTDAETILKVWSANPDFKLKDVTLENFKTEADRFIAILASLEAKEEEMQPLRNDRDDLAPKLNGLCTRARAGIKGYFGENSSEYEAAGGTRSSERKKGGRKAKASDAKPS